MNRNADGIDILTVNFQRANTFGHHRLGFDIAAVGGNFHGIAVADAELIRQFFTDLHELFRLGDGVK
ncbi:Uncharacterised protein [Klebsiella pneumoniae]|nr:Uncharacterised protein [Klebsiella pneumoniae]